MKYMVTLNGKGYEVEVERGEAILLNVSDVVAAAPVAAPVAAAPAAAAPVAAAPVAAPAGGDPITAPMPGTILNIFVNAGDRVTNGQVLLTMEAMKMENEITSPRDGVVSAITTSKGSAVSNGDILVVLQ